MFAERFAFAYIVDCPLEAVLYYALEEYVRLNKEKSIVFQMYVCFYLFHRYAIKS